MLIIVTNYLFIRFLVARYEALAEHIVLQTDRVSTSYASVLKYIYFFLHSTVNTVTSDARTKSQPNPNILILADGFRSL